MKNLIPFALFEALKPEYKLTTLKRKLMNMLSDKYSTPSKTQNGEKNFNKFIAPIGDVVNSYLKTQDIDALYKYTNQELKDKVFAELDEKVVRKLKNNDQFKKLFLEK